MPFRTPRWLAAFCKEVLPLMFRSADGRRMLRSVEAIVETDRWTSFDRCHDTTETLLEELDAAGAATEVHTIPTGGQIGAGRWTIQEAQDVHKATVDIVKPVRERIVDCAENPWHYIRWSTSTPPNGMTNELAVVDSEEALDRIPRNGLAGKIALTTASLRSRLTQWSDRGVAGLLVETPISGKPGATGWTGFGWGGVALEHAGVRLVALAICEKTGKKLRRLVQAHGRVMLKTALDIRRYAGSHDVASGIVWGELDPQDEVWALAHSAEPGASDNASGVATCIEVARIVESLIKAGSLPRPKRSIRLLNGYECYGFFHYLEHVKRFQTPLAGVCIDCVGIKPKLCDRRLEWHATIPMSAGFVDALGEGIVRAALRVGKPGYQCKPMPFASTSDTLIGDPKYGFPCPWLATYRGHKKPGYDVYHSSADTPDVLSAKGLAAGAVAAAAYLYFLANADSDDVARLASWETERSLQSFAASRKKLSPAQADFVRTRHHLSIERLQRWLWGGERSAILAHLSGCERQVREAVQARTKKATRRRNRDGRVPRRNAPISPTLENTPPQIAARIRKADLPAWALFWADGKRDLTQIADMAACELGKDVSVEQATGFFDAHKDLGYVDLAEPKDMVAKAQLVRGLRKLGVDPGMDLMAHTSLSGIGYVAGGAETVVDALLAAIGKRGTLMMPTFNHTRAEVYNPMTTPTVNGAINDAMWRRPDAVRSNHTSHSLAAIGPKAEEFCRGHLETGIWEQDSPIGRLVHAGGYILLLGTESEARTAYHIAENAMGAKCCDPFGTRTRIVRPDGAVEIVRGLAWRDAACPVSPKRMNGLLDKRGLQRRGRVGKGPAILVKAKDLWEVRCEQLKRACPTCKIKPKAYTFPKRQKQQAAETRRPRAARADVLQPPRAQLGAAGPRR